MSTVCPVHPGNDCPAYPEMCGNRACSCCVRADPNDSTTAPAYHPLPPQHVTSDAHGFDELYLRDVEVHLEQLTDGSAYLHIWGGGKTVHLDLAADKGRLVVTPNLVEGIAEESV